MRYIESIRLQDAELINYEYHRKRVYESSGLILPEISIPREYSKGLYKLRLVYSDKIEQIDYIRYEKRELKRLKVINITENIYPFKYEDRTKLEYLYSQKGIADDILICINNICTDTSFTNIVFEDVNSAYYTSNTCLLKGTKRQSLLDNGLIKLRDISILSIPQYKRIHLINAFLDLGDLVISPLDIIL